MGLGDAKLMIGIGWLLGMSAGVTAVLFAFWIGAAFSVVLLFIATMRKKGKMTMKTAIPFGPFLALGTVIVVLCQIDFQSVLAFFAR